MRILITAGGTREYIDPVRFISNASSGKMGYALAKAAIKAGHRVTMITTVEKTNFKFQISNFKLIIVQTAAQMFETVKKNFEKCDCLIMAAAVADYTPARPAKTKIKKTNKSLTIKLELTADILKWAGIHKKKNQVVVGFALEDRNVKARAEKKFKKKNLDMIIANTPGAIGSDKTTAHIKTAESNWTKIEDSTKSATAGSIIRMVEKIRM